MSWYFNVYTEENKQNLKRYMNAKLLDIYELLKDQPDYFRFSFKVEDSDKNYYYQTMNMKTLKHIVNAIKNRKE